MKSRYNNVNFLTCDPNRTVCIKAGELREKFVDEVTKASEDYGFELFKKNAATIIPQFMAVTLFELHTHFGFGKKRIQEFKEGVDGYMEIMHNGGFVGQKFDTATCIQYAKDTWGIDLMCVDLDEKIMRE